MVAQKFDQDLYDKQVTALLARGYDNLLEDIQEEGRKRKRGNLHSKSHCNEMLILLCLIDLPSNPSFRVGDRIRTIFGLHAIIESVRNDDGTTYDIVYVNERHGRDFDVKPDFLKPITGIQETITVIIITSLYY